MGAITGTPAVQETPPVADPVEVPASPTPPETQVAPDAQVEGDAPADAEGDEYEPSDDELAIAAKVFKTKRFAPVIEESVSERLKEREPELEAQAEQKARTRTQEMDGGEQARTGYYTQAERDARAAAKSLKEDWEAGYTIDATEGEKRMTSVLAGALAIAARDNEATIKALETEHLPKQTEAEKATLDQAYYDFQRNGNFTEYLPTLVQTIRARDAAEIKDLRKQLGDKKAAQSAAEKLADAANNAGPGVGSETPQGRAPRNVDNSDAARQARLAAGKGTPEDSRWLQERYPG